MLTSTCNILLDIHKFSFYANVGYNYSGPMKTQLSICIEKQSQLENWDVLETRKFVTCKDMKCPNPKKKQQQKMFSCLPDRICTSCKIQNSLENLIIPYLKVSHVIIREKALQSRIWLWRGKDEQMWKLVTRFRKYDLFIKRNLLMLVPFPQT